MGKIYYMMGKSSSGKDTLLRELRRALPELRAMTLYTTRPPRDGERNGVEYFFVSEDTLNAYGRQGRIIEERAYDTMHGIWRYATVDDGQVELREADYLVIGTLESYHRMREYYGEDNVRPIYIEVEDGERLTRALEREKGRKVPGYAELCRRYLAKAGIGKRYLNYDRTRCLEEIIGEIQNGKL